MNNLTLVEKSGVWYADSRDVAEMVDKRHADLLETIKGYIEHLLNGNFRSADFFNPSTYQDSTGRTLLRYDITRKGCDMVANKMTGERGVLFTATYVTKFEEMDKQLTKAQSPAELIAAGYQAALQLIEDMKPKAASFDSLISADGLYTVADAAKILNYDKAGPKKIFKVLEAEGFLFYKVGWHAYQLYINDGYFITKTRKVNFGDSNPDIYNQVFVTPKGLDMLDKHFGRNGFKKLARSQVN